MTNKERHEKLKFLGWHINYVLTSVQEIASYQKGIDRMLKELIADMGGLYVSRPHQKTKELESMLLDIMKKYPNGIHIKSLMREINRETNSIIPSHKIINRVSNMYRKRGLITKVSKGTYKAKDTKHSERGAVW